MLVLREATSITCRRRFSTSCPQCCARSSACTRLDTRTKSQGNGRWTRSDSLPSKQKSCFTPPTTPRSGRNCFLREALIFLRRNREFITKASKLTLEGVRLVTVSSKMDVGGPERRTIPCWVFCGARPNPNRCRLGKPTVAAKIGRVIRGGALGPLYRFGSQKRVAPRHEAEHGQERLA